MEAYTLTFIGKDSTPASINGWLGFVLRTSVGCQCVDQQITIPICENHELS